LCIKNSKTRRLTLSSTNFSTQILSRAKFIKHWNAFDVIGSSSIESATTLKSYLITSVGINYRLFTSVAVNDKIILRDSSLASRLELRKSTISCIGFFSTIY
jgi:hypothetical protein